MKILQLCSLFGDSFFSNLFDSINCDMTIFYPRRNDKIFENNNPNVVTENVYTIFDGKTYYSKEFKIYKHLKNNINLCDYNIVHAHTLYTDGAIANQIYKTKGIPYIVAVRNTDLKYYYKYRKDLYCIAKSVLLNAKRVIFLSKSYMNLTEKLFHIDLSEKSQVIPNGLDSYFYLNRFFEKKDDKLDIINVLTVGYISRRKNQISVAEAINQLIMEGHKLSYTVVGKILDKKIANELLKYEFVEYKPFMTKEELIKEYRRCDVFAMPSLNETFGLTYLEAISQNLPVIYSKFEGFDELFSNGQVGYSVFPEDIKEIKKSIIKIKNNKGKYKNISSAVEEFSWNKIGKKYNVLYKEVVDEQS